MEKEKIDRINFLARKSKTDALTPAELAEQAALRKEYIEQFRASFRSTLDHTSVVSPDGTKESLKERGAREKQRKDGKKT